MKKIKKSNAFIDWNHCKNLTKIKLYKNKCVLWINKKKAVYVLSFRHDFRDLKYVSDIWAQLSLHSGTMDLLFYMGDTENKP